MGNAEDSKDPDKLGEAGKTAEEVKPQEAPPAEPSSTPPEYDTWRTGP